MEKLIELVRAYLEEVERQNRFNSLVLSNLEICCSDIDKVNEFLDAMNNINDVQYKYTLLRNELTNPEDIVNIVLKIRETSNYLSLASDTLTNISKETNKGLDKFKELIGKVKEHSKYIVDIMDNLLRYYIVNLTEELQINLINSLNEDELNKVLESLGKTISINKNDTYAKEVVDKLLNRKVDIMESNISQEEITEENKKY